MRSSQILRPIFLVPISLLVVTSCSPPIIHSFRTMPSTVCPGDHATVAWDVSNAVNVTLQVPGVDPRFPNPLRGDVSVRLGTTDLTASMSANGAGSRQASSTISVFRGQFSSTVAATPQCSGESVTVRANLSATAGLPASLVVAGASFPAGRTGELKHLGKTVPFSAGGPTTTNEFNRMPLFGEWTLTYRLIPPEACPILVGQPGTHPGMQTSSSVPALSAAVAGSCPTAAGAPQEPSFVRSDCGRLGQACCPTTAPCDEGGTCQLGQCAMAARTCTGALAGASSQQFILYRVDPSSGCATGEEIPVLADSLEEARRCLSDRNITALTPDERRNHTWRNDSNGCASGSFFSSDADAQRCANSLCGCTNAQLDGEPCF